MMNKKKDKDEYLEQLWYMKEKSINAIDELIKNVHAEFNEQMLEELVQEELIVVDNSLKTVMLTDKGEKNARQIIRAHRLAERLICDVLGEDYEAGAGEFEHTINLRLVDGICTLLGHPRECPHGKPIPEGECCRRLEKTAKTAVVPFTELEVGQKARVAYVQCKNDQQLHRISGLQIRPGANIKLHQKYPTFVVECEGASIALSDEVAMNICVWTKEGGVQSEKHTCKENRGFWRGFRHKNRRRGAFK